MAAPLLPDLLWELIEPLLPLEPSRPKGGRPRLPDHRCLAGILFILRRTHSLGDVAQRTGLPLWNDLLATLAGLAACGRLVADPFCPPGLVDSL
jgi:hypothetical protein